MPYIPWTDIQNMLNTCDAVVVSAAPPNGVATQRVSGVYDCLTKLVGDNARMNEWYVARHTGPYVPDGMQVHCAAARRSTDAQMTLRRYSYFTPDGGPYGDAFVVTRPH